MKTHTLDWNQFMEGKVVEKEKKQPSAWAYAIAPVKAVAVAATTEQSETWKEIFETALGVADWLCVGVIIFAGVTWMFGNRTKAIELLIGTCSGYLIVRHSMDIMIWLRGI